MATIVKWCGFAFVIKKSKIIGVKDLNVSLSIETESKTSSSENYIKRKHYNPAEITMTGMFSRALGVEDVKESAYKLADLCRQGKTGYIYIGKTKLMPPKFIGVSAKISDIEIIKNGEWSYCEVAVTLKQCEKYGGGTSGKKKKKKKKSSGSKKKSGGDKKRSIYDQDAERKKQMEEAKKRAKEEAEARKRAKDYTKDYRTRVTKPASPSRRMSGTTM